MTLTRGASLMCCFREVDDPRKPSNGTLHDFQEVLVIAIAAVLSDCDTIEDIALWGREKEDWLRQFLVLRNGVASEETFLRIFRFAVSGTVYIISAAACRARSAPPS